MSRTEGPWDDNWLEFRTLYNYDNGFPLNQIREGAHFYDGYNAQVRIYGSCVVIPYRMSIAFKNGAWDTNDNWQTVQGYIYVSNPHSTAEDKPCGVYINGVYDNSATGFNNKQLNGIQCLTFERRHVINVEPKLWTNKISHYD